MIMALIIFELVSGNKLDGESLVAQTLGGHCFETPTQNLKRK